MKHDWYLKKPTLKPTIGGIKAQTKRGSFAQNWWAKRWISALESFHDSARLGRGRSYARRGQVMSINILKGLVKANVQGSRSTPYRVTVEVDTLSKEAWGLVIEELCMQAIFAAKLMAGEMPSDIEAVFQKASLSLLPTTHHELKTDCSCPDWSNPCKHVAAVYYLLGEEFDRDPFLIFKLRGIERETFLSQLSNHIHPSQRSDQEIKEKSEPLPTTMSQFWQAAPLPPDFLSQNCQLPEKQGILLKSLGKFPFWQGESSFQDSLEAVYSKASCYVGQILSKPLK